MLERGQQLSDDSAGQLSDEDRGNLGDQEDNNQKVVTFDESMLRELIQQETANAYQSIQSRQDALEKSVQTQSEAIIARLKKSGVELTSDQQSAIETDTRDSIVAEASQADPGNQADPGQQTQQGDDAKTQSDLVLAVREMETIAGVELFESDEEFTKLLDQSTPLKFLDSYKVALEAKKESEGRAATTRVPTIGGGPTRTGNPLSNVTDINELYKLANKKRR